MTWRPWAVYEAIEDYAGTRKCVNDDSLNSMKLSYKNILSHTYGGYSYLKFVINVVINYFYTQEFLQAHSIHPTPPTSWFYQRLFFLAIMDAIWTSFILNIRPHSIQMHKTFRDVTMRIDVNRSIQQWFIRDHLAWREREHSAWLSPLFPSLEQSESNFLFE